MAESFTLTDATLRSSRDATHYWETGPADGETGGGKRGQKSGDRRVNRFLFVETLGNVPSVPGFQAQILQRNESRDIHMPRSTLNTEGPKTKSPPIRANGAR